MQKYVHTQGYLHSTAGTGSGMAGAEMLMMDVGSPLTGMARHDSGMVEDMSTPVRAGRETGRTNTHTLQIPNPSEFDRYLS
jgi:hypothetical protein